MSDPFTDYNLMQSNLAAIERGDKIAFRVSAEHYLWLCSGRSLVAAIRDTVGGEVDGHPTSVINILQRVRQLVEIEKATLTTGQQT
jgi:hypothetical protein